MQQRFIKRKEALVAKPRNNPALRNQNRTFDLGLVARLVGPGRNNGGIIMRRHIGVGAIEGTGTALTKGKPKNSGFHQRFATILFTSHETAQTFNRPSKSKAWLHPDFDYAAHASDPTQWSELAKQFQSYRIIHDEIAIDDLVWSHSPAEVDFADTVKHAGNKGWADMSMPEKTTVVSRSW